MRGSYNAVSVMHVQYLLLGILPYVIFHLQTSAMRSGLKASIRSDKVASFKVMDVLRKANELQSMGKDIIHLEVGQPQSNAPSLVLEAANLEISKHRLGYTESAGIPSLKDRICRHYQDKYSCKVSPKNVIVTTGSSGAFLLAFLGAFDAGDYVAVGSASYPCYRNILNSLGCKVVTIPMNDQFKITASELQKFLEKEKSIKLKGIILSSPSNPTGAMLSNSELKDLTLLCSKEGILFISDEIYHGITFGDEAEQTALTYSTDCIVINSFSKYYSMTGWRLGWVVVPDALFDACDRLMQNLYISAPTLSQVAAISAFDCTKELDEHVRKYRRNRDILLKGLNELGFQNISPCNGAIYIYADTSNLVDDSVKLAADLLDKCGVAVTPGIDFEDPSSNLGHKRLRFSFCGSTEDMEKAVLRMKTHWPTIINSQGKAL